MTNVLDPDILADALRRHGATMTTQEYTDILHEVMNVGTETLTEAERTFLIEHGNVDPDLLTPQARQSAALQIADQGAQADMAAIRSGLTTRQVAQMMGTAPANVRREAGNSRLYTAGRGKNRELIFPTWQFNDNRPLSHLPDLLAALPDTLHPLDVETFMTSPHEALSDRSPRTWLAGGGQPDPVLRLIDDLGRM